MSELSSRSLEGVTLHLLLYLLLPLMRHQTINPQVFSIIFIEKYFVYFPLLVESWKESIRILLSVHYDDISSILSSATVI